MSLETLSKVLIELGLQLELVCEICPDNHIVSIKESEE